MNLASRRAIGILSGGSWMGQSGEIFHAVRAAPRPGTVRPVVPPPISGQNDGKELHPRARRARWESYAGRAVFR